MNSSSYNLLIVWSYFTTKRKPSKIFTVRHRIFSLTLGKSIDLFQFKYRFNLPININLEYLPLVGEKAK